MKMAWRARYWVLPDYSSYTKARLLKILDEHHYEVKKSSDKAELLFHINRAKRYMVCYLKCSTAELHQFVKDRNLIPSLPLTLSRSSLSKVLTTADNDLRFNRILDLPAELRKEIYEYYVDFEDELAALCPPPLAQASKQLKAEVLPIFHNRCVFLLDFDYGNARFEHTRLRYSGFAPSLVTKRLLKSNRTRLGANITKMRIHLRGYKSWTDTDFTIEVGAGVKANGGRYNVTFRELEGSPTQRRVQQDIEGMLGYIFRRTSNRQERRGIDALDLKMISTGIREVRYKIR
jgi:hypothetical protein